jgi:hypothetical protein
MCRLSETRGPAVSSVEAWRAFVQALRDLVGGKDAPAGPAPERDAPAQGAALRTGR